MWVVRQSFDGQEETADDIASNSNHGDLVVFSNIAEGVGFVKMPGVDGSGRLHPVCGDVDLAGLDATYGEEITGKL